MSQVSEDVQAEIDRCFADPLGYVLYNFPWGQPGTPLQDFPHGPDQWQRDEFLRIAAHVLENLRRRDAGLPMLPYQSAVASGHGIGKSAFIAWAIKWLMDTRPNCRGVVTANTGDQLEKKTWPELNKWHSMSLTKEWCRWTATKFYSLLTSDGEANWRFDAVTWSEENTEAFAGLHNAGSAVVVLMDEGSAIADKIWEVSEGAMTDGEPFWFAFGNPTRNTGRFRQCFGKFRHRWHTRHIDSRTVRITNKSKLAEWVNDYGEDSDFVKVRVRGQFPAMGDKQFISSKEVDDAQKRQVMPDPGAPLTMGVDVARFGSAKSVIRFRRGRDARSIPPLKFRGLDNVQLAGECAAAIDKWKPDAVCIDAGNGTGVIDILRHRRYRVHEIWFGSKSESGDYADKRTELWVRTRDWLPGGAIDEDQELADDLIGPEKTYTGAQGDTLKLESKETMEKRGLASPDDGDALALTFAVRVSRTDTRTARGNRSKQAEGVEAEQFGE